MQTELLHVRGWPEALEQARPTPMVAGLAQVLLWPVGAKPSQLDWQILDAEEQQRAERFARSVHKERFVLAHAGLRRWLAACTAAKPEALRFARAGAGQKPHLQSSSIHFNLSHSQGWAAAVILDGYEAGIDIEAIRAIEPELPQRFFSEKEQMALATLTGEAWLRGCFCAWTRKEALLKATGAGLALPLRAFSVSVLHGAPAALLASELPELSAESWNLVDIDCIPGYCGALAVPREVEHVSIFVIEGEDPCQ